MCTHNARTRDNHARLDGEIVDSDQKFIYRLMFPADTSGIPAKVYNYRCTLRALLPYLNYQKRDTHKDWAKRQYSKNLDAEDVEIMVSVNDIKKEVTDKISSFINIFEKRGGFHYSKVVYHNLGATTKNGRIIGKLLVTSITIYGSSILTVNKEIVEGKTLKELDKIVKGQILILVKALKIYWYTR